MSKNQNTFAKRQREMEKKAKADRKRERRIQRKLSPESPDQDATAELETLETDETPTDEEALQNESD